MALFDKGKTKDLKMKAPREILYDMLKASSGAGFTRSTWFNIFYQTIAFKGVAEGVGTSTIVANTAVALAAAGCNVCVIDSSVLAPVQDVLLRTDWMDKDPDKRTDWFDMMYTDDSVLNKSKINKNISVLSFKGKKRDITDVMGNSDSDLLVETALSVLHGKFDVILVDCCHELTQVAAACLQQSQHVIQVWSDTPHLLSNVDMWITNNVILSCPMDKMRYVVINKFVDDIPNNFDAMLTQYRFIKLSMCKMSLDIARVNAIGKTVWGYPSMSQDLEMFNDMVADIAAHILGIDLSTGTNRGTITSNDIEEGKVEGTVHKKMVELDKKIPEINEGYQEQTSGKSAVELDSNENTAVEEYMEMYEENEPMPSDNQGMGYGDASEAQDEGVQEPGDVGEIEGAEVAEAAPVKKKRGLFGRNRGGSLCLH